MLLKFGIYWLTVLLQGGALSASDITVFQGQQSQELYNQILKHWNTLLTTTTTGTWCTSAVTLVVGGLIFYLPSPASIFFQFCLKQCLSMTTSKNDKPAIDTRIRPWNRREWHKCWITAQFVVLTNSAINKCWITAQSSKTHVDSK